MSAALYQLGLAGLAAVRRALEIELLLDFVPARKPVVHHQQRLGRLT